ncbi:MAG: hypothetical protein ACREOO_06180 [bacterium]
MPVSLRGMEAALDEAEAKAWRSFSAHSARVPFAQRFLLGRLDRSTAQRLSFFP